MRKWFSSICVLTLISLLVVSPALAWEVTKWKTKELPVAGDVYFSSAFRAANGETITITLDPLDDPDIDISYLTLVKVTPKPNLENGNSITIVGYSSDYHEVYVTLQNSRAGKSSFHLWLYLSTDEHVGVNVHFGR